MFGDLVLWYQVIDKAKTAKLPIVIVTDDVKDDWWLRHEGKIVGPHPGLVEEMREVAKVGFYMYVSDQFIEYARDYLKQTVDQKTINEVREVRKQEEQQRTAAEQFLVFEEYRLIEYRQQQKSVAAKIGTLRSEVASIEEETSRILSESEGANFARIRTSLIELDRRRRELSDDISRLETFRRHLREEADLVRMRRNSVQQQAPIQPRTAIPRYAVNREILRHTRNRLAIRAAQLNEQSEREAESPGGDSDSGE